MESCFVITKSNWDFWKDVPHLNARPEPQIKETNIKLLKNMYLIISINPTAKLCPIWTEKITYYPWVKLLDPTAKTDSILKIDPFLYQNQSYYYYINYYINLTNYIQHIVRTIKYVQLLSMINIFQWCCLKKYRSKKLTEIFQFLPKNPLKTAKKA